MEKLGIIKSEEAFYEILFEKWNEYLHKIKSGKRLLEILGKDLLTIQDMKSHMEEIKIYMRGHNLYDIFYGRYKGNEEEMCIRDRAAGADRFCAGCARGGETGGIQQSDVWRGYSCKMGIFFPYCKPERAI